MKNKTKRLLKILIGVLLIGILGLVVGAKSVYAHYFLHENGLTSNLPSQCYVSPGQKVVEWKSASYRTGCGLSVAGICVWPIPHKHVTYKVTVNDGIPLQTTDGKVIAATNGEERNWLTYDSKSWNAIPNKRFERYIYSDFQPIASNEYVVMVQTRYRLFNDVDSTLGICIQQ